MLPKISNIMPTIRGLNLWTLVQKVKDATIQRTSTIQLLQRIDIYKVIDVDRAYLLTIQDPKVQQEFIKTHGKLYKTTGIMPSHSFVLQFQQIFIDSMMSRAYAGNSTNPTNTTASVRDTGNTLRQLFYGGVSVHNMPAANSPAGTTTYGIQVGTGANAPASTNYVMQTLTAQGTSANQLQYQATAVGSAGVVGSNVDTLIARVLVNGSGGTITLLEVGLTVSVCDSGGAQRYFLVARDAVNQGIDNGAVAIVSYDVRTTT